MPTQQKIIEVYFEALKNLKDLPIRLDSEPLTALMGTNGCGKTTVLHALACVYAPPNENAPNYKLSTFFNPTRDSTWSGSSFRIKYNEREGANYNEGLEQSYMKAADRWTPRYERRPVRFTRLITIRESIPEVEFLGATGLIKYNRVPRASETDRSILDNAGRILNRNYGAYHAVNYDRGGRVSFGVTMGGLTYPALSMSAGEQRVFRILEAVFTSPDYSLILIDEIDLFLHQDALSRLIGVLHDHCSRRNKQLVMTTHFPPVASMYDHVAVTTLHRTPEKTVYWSGYSLSALRHITGDVSREVTIYVEDDLVSAIVGRLAIELRMRTQIDMVLYGAAINAFKLASGIVLAGRPIVNVLIVQDGDLYATKTERRQRVAQEITGTEAGRAEQRKSIVSRIRPLMPDRSMSPERAINEMLRAMPEDNLDLEEIDLLAIARDVVNVQDDHGLVSIIVQHTGEPRDVALSRLMKLASKSPAWRRYTRVIHSAMMEMRQALNIDPRR
ncbi:AAA family ATPase [Pseudomonas helleri]|uniref:AAA family ATPase n=1 Tax=Pseudomonas helleri TaxID=1608996 RepID=UPI003342AF5E